jgi:hypothetical protein
MMPSEIPPVTAELVPASAEPAPPDLPAGSATRPAGSAALALAPELVLTRAPDIVLAEAQRAARALKDVLEAKPKKVIFNDEQYLEFEDWQTLGRFYGVTCAVTSTRFVSYGEASGFSARAIALRADGAELSAAEAECLNDEAKWRSRPVYEWTDTPHGRRRMKVGEEAVPLFMLKSMAQTRACAKALRNVLAWVVVLAGYRPTPAEELPIDQAAPARKKTTTAPATRKPRTRSGPTSTSRLITERQVTELFTTARAAGWAMDQLQQELRTRFGVEKSRDIAAKDYPTILATISAGPSAPAAPAADQPF